jgi:hypothetical protein
MADYAEHKDHDLEFVEQRPSPNYLGLRGLVVRVYRDPQCLKWVYALPAQMEVTFEDGVTSLVSMKEFQFQPERR